MSPHREWRRSLTGPGNGRLVPLFVFVVALAVRLLFVATHPERTGPDSEEYRTLAENIGAHRTFSLEKAPPYTPSLRRAPGYPVFLWITRDSSDVTRRLQSFLDACVAALICLMPGPYVRRRWATAAALTYALHPGAIVYANSILSESVFTFLSVTAVALLALAARRDSVALAIASGVGCGLAALCRPIAAPFFLVAALVVLLTRRTLRRAGAIALAMTLATVVTLTPWIWRSSRLGGAFVLVCAGSTVNLALATADAPWNLNDQASIFGSAYYRTIDPCIRSLHEVRTPKDSVRSDSVCLQEAIENLRQNPRRYVRTRVSQLVHFPLTSFDFATGNLLSLGSAVAHRSYRVLATKLFLYAGFALAPLLLGLLGALLGEPTLEKRLFSALWLYTIAVYAPGFVEYRFFLPAVPALLVSAAYGLECVGKWRDGRWPSSRTALLAATKTAASRPPSDIGNPENRDHFR